MFRPYDSARERSPLDRLVDQLVDRSRRLSLAIRVAYLTALLGLAVTFVTPDSASGPVATAGIVLLFLSFVCLFYVSVTLCEIGCVDR